MKAKKKVQCFLLYLFEISLYFDCNCYMNLWLQIVYLQIVYVKKLYVHVTRTPPSVQLTFSGLLFIDFPDIFNLPAYQDSPPHNKLLAVIHKGIPKNKNRVKHIDKSQKDVLCTYQQTKTYQSQSEI